MKILSLRVPLFSLAVSLLVACASVPTTQAPQVPPIAAQPGPAATALADISAEEYAARRLALARLIGDGLVIAFGSPEPAADYLEFFQNSHFLYLTGIEEPGARLVMTVRAGVPEGMLFVRERDFARELWEGHRLGTHRAARLTGLHTRRVEDFPRILDSLLSSATRVRLIEGGDVPQAYLSPARQLTGELRGRAGVEVAVANGMVSQLRARKSAAELTLIRRAVEISVQGHAAAARAFAPERHEYEVEAALEHAFRSAGAERTAFASIVGSGPNSTVLHYNRNDRQMQAGDVAVVDIGASWRGYAGDVTRTYPVSGRFTPDQREIYQIVRDAQAAAERAVAVGSPASPHAQAAVAVIAEGLARLGLIEAPDATYDCEQGPEACAQYRLYYMHSLGHPIGLDVHDPGMPRGSGGTFAVGDVFSIEPGIYVRRNLLEIISDTPRNAQLKQRIAAAVARYGDIGVRIEDDYILTEGGLEWISRAPREIEEVEAAMR